MYFAVLFVYLQYDEGFTSHGVSHNPKKRESSRGILPPSSPMRCYAILLEISLYLKYENTSFYMSDGTRLVHRRSRGKKTYRAGDLVCKMYSSEPEEIRNIYFIKFRGRPFEVKDRILPQFLKN